MFYVALGSLKALAYLSLRSVSSPEEDYARPQGLLRFTAMTSAGRTVMFFGARVGLLVGDIRSPQHGKGATGDGM